MNNFTDIIFYRKGAWYRMRYLYHKRPLTVLAEDTEEDWEFANYAQNSVFSVCANQRFDVRCILLGSVTFFCF